MFSSLVGRGDGEEVMVVRRIAVKELIELGA